MRRAALFFNLMLLIQVASTQAAELVLEFDGVINSVIDNSTEGTPPIDFDPVPVGSLFSGTIVYDTDSPATDGGNGYTRYLDLLTSSSSLTVNGHTFTSGLTTSVGAIVSSQEAGFGFSGVSFSNQPVSMPPDWSVNHSEFFPYFTIQLWNIPAEAHSLALPSSQGEFPSEVMNLVLDFAEPVTVAGETYGGRVYITGEITSLQVVDPTSPPREVVVDVIPSSSHNNVNLSDKKPKPLEVAVFGESDFDVRGILPETIGLGDPVLTDPETGDGQKVLPISMRLVDLNRDQRLDLLLKFDLLEMKSVGAIGPTSTSLEFEALLGDQGVVFGSDAVTIHGGKGRGK
ncbi:MAG: hypothetical protein JNG89_18950 [Planctomycetaceae bacterium]|nr:hypothetical protein [Planctomycetaceae bacterium]